MEWTLPVLATCNVSAAACTPTITRTRILAYLGQLKPDEWASARKLCYDLDLRFTTAKNVLTALEDRGWVEKMISSDKGIIAKFRIDPAAITKQITPEGTSKMVGFIPPEWEPAYGRHPHAT